MKGSLQKELEDFGLISAAVAPITLRPPNENVGQGPPALPPASHKGANKLWCRGQLKAVFQKSSHIPLLKAVSCAKKLILCKPRPKAVPGQPRSATTSTAGTALRNKGHTPALGLPPVHPAGSAEQPGNAGPSAELLLRAPPAGKHLVNSARTRPRSREPVPPPALPPASSRGSAAPLEKRFQNNHNYRDIYVYIHIYVYTYTHTRIYMYICLLIYTHIGLKGKLPK